MFQPPRRRERHPSLVWYALSRPRVTSTSICFFDHYSLIKTNRQKVVSITSYRLHAKAIISKRYKCCAPCLPNSTLWFLDHVFPCPLIFRAFVSLCQGLKII